ncbi:hypothetical protein SBBP1_330020 [Burkholderiales bacterium]|nr:hypothetical protein SBBP1_330020 [Burkholderiales bacterium]
MVRPGRDSSAPRSKRSCWMSIRSSRTPGASSCVSSRPMCEFNSSMSPIAAMRALCLPVRVPSPSPVVPSSPVRVTIVDSRFANGTSRLSILLQFRRRQAARQGPAADPACRMRLQEVGVRRSRAQA